MKHRLLCGVGIMILFFWGGCGSENSHSEAVETKSENASQILYSVTIEGQMYLPEQENLSTNVLDAEGLYVFLNGLSYSNEICDGLPEYSIHFNNEANKVTRPQRRE